MIGIEPTSALEPKPQPAARHREGNLVFDYRALRFVVGLLAFIFPWVVTIRAQMILSSISWSYHTDARDQFVGGMCVIGILLIAYKGHKPVLPPEKVGRFWQLAGVLLNGLRNLWGRKTDYRVWWREHEEDLVSTIG